MATEKTTTSNALDTEFRINGTDYTLLGALTQASDLIAGGRNDEARELILNVTTALRS